jgi:hypothetical protein
MHQNEKHNRKYLLQNQELSSYLCTKLHFQTATPFFFIPYARPGGISSEYTAMVSSSPK